MGELAHFIELAPRLARAVLHPAVYALGIEIVEAKRELADPESQFACLEHLFFGMQMHMPDVVIEALDERLGRGHDRIAVVPASELHALNEDDPTPIALLPNGDPNFSYRPKIKVYADVPEHGWSVPGELQNLGPVIEDGRPLMSEEDLRLLFAAHGRAFTEGTLRQIHKFFRDLRAEWRQAEQDRVDTFVRELRDEHGIGQTGGISYRDGERLARESGLNLSQTTIRRRLDRL